MNDEHKTKEQLIAELKELRETNAEQESLRESWRLLCRILCVAPLGIAHLEERRLKWTNPCMVGMFGFEREEDYLNKDIVEFYASEEEYKRVREHLYRDLRAGRPSETEAQFKRADGSVFRGYMKVSALDPSDPRRGTISILLDVSERRRTQDAPRQSEERYRTTIENIEEGYYEVDSAGNILFCNGSMCSILDYTNTDLKRAAIGREDRVLALARDISDRKKAEEELRKTRERLELALSGADLGLWDWDLTTGRTVWNERAISMLGYSGEDVRPDLHFWKSLVHPEDWAEVSERLNAHLEGRLPLVETEHRLRCKSGEWKWILARGKVAERDKGGKPLRMAGTTLDIDERKRTEKELRQSEALYRAIFHNAATGINLNCHGKVSEVNSAWTRMLGYSQGELMGLTFLDVTHPDDLEISKRYHDALLRGETDSYRLEKRYIRKDGQVLWADVWVSAIRDEAGQYQATIAAVIDITDKKHAEEALQRSEANFRSIFDSMNDAVFVHDLETGRILDVNRKMCEMFGYTADEARGLSVGQISLGEPPYSQEDSLQWIARAIQEGPQLFEWQSKDKAGRLFQAEVSLKRAAIEGQDRVLAVVRDISDRKRAEREKENLMAQLVQAQKNQAIGTLAGGIAHDFNNLLTIILGYSELLVQDTPATDPKHADLRKIVETAASGADLVKRLLTFSRRADSEPRPLNLNSRIAQIKELLSKTIPKTVRIDLVLAGDLAPIHADPAQMDQVVMNLAINAAESMPDGGILTIETGNVHLDDQFCRTHHGVESGEYVLLRVSDSGCGMDKQTMERMFDPFFTAKGWDFRKGKGLGLAVVQGVVQQHGGYLGCDSEAGKGTTFVIYFPVRKEEGGSTEMKTEAPPVGRAETILLVDDEEYIRDLAKRHLSRAGYTVLEAADGQEAVEVYRKELKSISIVILDLVMPEMGGKRCLEKLVGINPGVRVLVMTGFSADQVDEDLRNNVRAFLTKPFDMRQLVEAVREVLDSD